MRWAAALLLLALAACGEPEPGSAEWAEQRLKQQDEARRSVREVGEARERERLTLGAQPAASPARLKEELLLEYGARLTRLQRSALLAVTIASREEGEDMCRKWIAENDKFGRGVSGEEKRSDGEKRRE